MPDTKQMTWAERYGTDAETNSKTDESSLPADQPAANDADGWQQYRRWITKAPAPRSRRNGIDPSLYSWKGYREWSDQVKRNWSKEDRDKKS